MLKITFWGTASGMPEKGKRHSCLLVQKDGEYTGLLDVGEGVCFTFVEEGFEANDIDFIFITHFHPDHSAGLFMLLQTFIMKNRTKKLTIFIPEQLKAFQRSLHFFYIFVEKQNFEVDIKDCQNISDYYPDIQSFKTDHLLKNIVIVTNLSRENQMYSYGVHIRHKNKIISYTSDFRDLETIEEYLQNTDICITDAAHPTQDGFNTLLNIIKEKIYLTHGNQNWLPEYIKDKPKFEYVSERSILTFSD